MTARGICQNNCFPWEMVGGGGFKFMNSESPLANQWLGQGLISVGTQGNGVPLPPKSAGTQGNARNSKTKN